LQQDSPHFASCLAILKQSALFGQLSEAVLQDMLRIFHYTTRAKGETAISPTQAADRLYLIISGRAKVSVYNRDNGREHILFLIGPGDSFDLISLLDGQWHEAVATALDDMEVISTSVEQAREWINRHPDFNRAFLPYLGKQMHKLADQVTDLSLYDTEARLARLILRNITPVSDKFRHEAVATALDDIEVISTSVEQAREWINRHPDFNRAFLPYLGEQMHKLADQVTDLSLYDTEARLARLILRNITPVSDKFHQEAHLINDLSQETLASMIGSVRVIVTRHLLNWKQEKVISGKRGHWSVLDLKALLEKAEKLL